MENPLLFIFGKIWPETMYYSTWSWAKFLSNFKNSKKSNFYQNQFKLYKGYPVENPAISITNYKYLSLPYSTCNYIIALFRLLD